VKDWEVFSVRSGMCELHLPVPDIKLMCSLNPRLYRMIFDVLRFNLFALDILKEEGTDDMSIGEYLDREGYGDGFKEDYLLVYPFISGVIR
jgi:predicted NAD/FAD-binding protein